MKFCLILLLTVAIAQGQSLLTISPGEATDQKTNVTLPVMNSSGTWVGTSRLLMYAPPKQYNMAGWKLAKSGSKNTTNSAFAFSVTNTFQSIITTIKTNNTTNVTERAIYDRVGCEADKLMVTNKVASIQKNLIENPVK